MLLPVVIMGCLAAVVAAALSLAASRLRANGDDAVERINSVLPQTQCAQCGYPGCRQYAEALITGAARINQCPPGGKSTIRALARLLGQNPLAPDPSYGSQKTGVVAVINEDACIGCARCIEVCPVDAILGASRYMHTVIAAECTGCELCIAPCPVDCIALRMPA